MRLLIVEDDKDLAMTLAQGCREEGFSVDLAFDGESGLDLAESGEHDAIVLDLMLPRLDGFEIVKRLRGGKRPSQ